MTSTSRHDIKSRNDRNLTSDIVWTAEKESYGTVQAPQNNSVAKQNKDSNNFKLNT